MASQGAPSLTGRDLSCNTCDANTIGHHFLAQNTLLGDCLVRHSLLQVRCQQGVPEPVKPSRTRSPRREQSRIASATIRTGFTVGCVASASSLCLVIIENGGNNGENQWQLERHQADHSLSPNDREKSAITLPYRITTRHRAYNAPRPVRAVWIVALVGDEPRVLLQAASR